MPKLDCFSKILIKSETLELCPELEWNGNTCSYYLNSKELEHDVVCLLVHTRKQLQAEKARADKAEEMVTDDYSCAIGSYKTCNCIMGTIFSDSIKQTAQALRDSRSAHNKRKCDEIVGKIEADIQYTIKHAKTGTKDFELISEGKVFAFNIGIDIVKSVMGGEL